MKPVIMGSMSLSVGTSDSFVTMMIRTDVAAGRNGHPFHPLLVTVPIGAWVASVVFDLTCAYGGRVVDEGTQADGYTG